MNQRKPLKELAFQALEDLLLDTDDIEELYRLQLELGKRLSAQHLLVFDMQDERNKISLKKDLSWIDNMIDICNKKQELLKDNNNAFNKRFRVEAKRLLEPSIYNQIAREAQTQ